MPEATIFNHREFSGTLGAVVENRNINVPPNIDQQILNILGRVAPISQNRACVYPTRPLYNSGIFLSLTIGYAVSTSVDGAFTATRNLSGNLIIGRYGNQLRRWDDELYVRAFPFIFCDGRVPNYNRRGLRRDTFQKFLKHCLLVELALIRLKIVASGKTVDFCFSFLIKRNDKNYFMITIVEQPIAT